MRYNIQPMQPLVTVIERAKLLCPQILADSLQNEKRLEERCNAYLLLADLIGGALPEMVREPNGKPVFADGQPYFSISHTDTGAAAVIADFPVGIDLQKIVPVKDRWIARVCTEAESDYIRSGTDDTDRAARFFRIWTAKEAAAKATGYGIGALGFKRILVDCDARTAEANGKRWQLCYPECEIENTICCIANQIYQ